jgi:hypothetical protein
MDMGAGPFSAWILRKTLILMAHQGLGQALIDLVKQLPVADSIVAQVMQSMHPEARSITEYPPGPVRAALEADGWETIVSIPLIAQEKILGAINVTSRLHEKPAPEALAVPAAIGQQIGVAIDNARLYAQSVEYARQMELARQAAEAANASKSDFLANVSHELRTPLVSILGFARLVQKRLEERIRPALSPGDDKTQRAEAQIEENLDIILAEGQRLTTLINNLLDLEKIEAGKMEWHIQPLAIGEVIQHATARPLLYSMASHCHWSWMFLAISHPSRATQIADAGGDQFNFECSKILARRDGDHPGAPERGWTGRKRDRPGHWHRSIGSGAPVRKIYPGRRSFDQQAKRHRIGIIDHQGDRRTPWRAHLGRKRTGQRQHIRIYLTVPSESSETGPFEPEEGPCAAAVLVRAGMDRFA